MFYVFGRQTLLLKLDARLKKARRVSDMHLQLR